MEDEYLFYQQQYNSPQEAFTSPKYLNNPQYAKQAIGMKPNERINFNNSRAAQNKTKQNYLNTYNIT